MMVLRLLKIPKSTYFDWVHYTESQRQREDTILKALLREIWQNNYKAYGAPRLRLALADLNLHHGTNRVRRLMREAGIYSVMTRRFNKPTTTVDYRQRPKLIRHFPKAKLQRCLVHVGRNLMNKVRVKDRKAVISDFKQVHRAANREAAELKLNELANNWHQTYPKLIKDLLKMPNLLTFMDFPPAIRQSLYSTNLIENFNKHLKRTTHHKEQFPTEDSLDRFLVSQFNVYNEKSLRRIHRGFKVLQDTLEASFI